MQVNVVGIRFKPTSKILQYAANILTLQYGEKCVAESEYGPAIATVAIPTRTLEVPESIAHSLPPLMRKATVEDMELAEGYQVRAQEAFALCRAHIQAEGLEMKLNDTEFTLDGQKAIFYFTAEHRVDFRSLVRYLASILKTRIEMRQIGPRDETKKLGGYGICGRPLCCAAFLTDFAPISVRMAKEQGLALTPSRISGVCGRLKCCLAYEMPVYKAIKDELPRIGEVYTTREGRGRVVDITVVGEAFAVELEESGKVVLVRLPSAPERQNNCTGCANRGLQESPTTPDGHEVADHD